MALRTAGRGGRRRARPGRSLAKSGAERRPPSHSRVSGSRTLGALPRAGRGRAADSVPNVPPAHTETGQRPGGELGPGGQLCLLRTRQPAAAARPGAEGPGGSLLPARPRPHPLAQCQPRGRLPSVSGHSPRLQSRPAPCPRGRGDPEESVWLHARSSPARPGPRAPSPHGHPPELPPFSALPVFLKKMRPLLLGVESRLHNSGLTISPLLKINYYPVF